MNDLTTNPILFGADPEERLVAIEVLPPSSVRIFRREKDQSITFRDEPFHLYSWSTDSIAGGGLQLQGSAPLAWLLRFENEAAQQNLRRAGHTTLFSLPSASCQYLTASGKSLFKGLAFDELRRLQIHLQTTCGAAPTLSRCENEPILTVALGDSTGWQTVLRAKDAESEKALLQQVTDLIRERDPDVIEGHNLFKFGLPYLAARAKKNRGRLTWGRDDSPLQLRRSRLNIAEKTIQYSKPSVFGRHVVDTLVLAQLHDVSHRDVESYELSALAEHFGISESTADSNPDSGKAAQQAVRETRALADLLSPSWFLQSRIFPLNYQDVILRGNATRINLLFLREYLRQQTSLPLPPPATNFAGATSAIFHTGVIKKVWHCDIASLYPSVMLADGLTPGTDSLGVFRSLLTDLRRFRLEAKAALREAASPAERQELNALQGTFKILINSFYGYLGFAQGHFADFEMAAAVTARGRELLQQMVDWLESEGARIIEIDTDGIYFQPPTGATASGLHAGLQAALPGGIEVEFDHQYEAMFSFKAKNYALLAADGRVHLTGGALKSRGLEPYLRDYLEQLISFLLKGDQAAATALASIFAEGLRSATWPIERLAKTEALQDSPAAYEKKITASSRNRAAAFELALQSGRDYEAGDQVSYYITGTKRKVTAYDHAKLVEEWNPASRDENVEYYVGKLLEMEKKFKPFLTQADQAELF